MDALYEFDREPVGESDLKPGRYFAGLFASEHVAATEFVIGAFFVLHGVAFDDLVLGLLVGNLLAVLSWTFVCAPIAVDTRLTLYWYLRRIAGPGLTLVYNVANAVLYCILAGAMIAVSATAVGLLFDLPAPGLEDVYPRSVAWVLTTFAIGAVITLFAILGFEKMSRLGGYCAPFVFLVFVLGAVLSFPKLGIEGDLSNFLDVARGRIWNGVPTPGQKKFSFAHVAFFAWFCNLAMHVGLSDMALFRYARSYRYGLYSALGMYLGHMLAWICSGIMVAAVSREMNPGLMAYEAVGVAGALTVFVAGWTTANPTLYRAGLALQTVTPGWPRWKVTLAAGAVTTLFSSFPAVFVKLLDYVALYGLVLMPVGAIVLAEHWIFPRLGLLRYEAEKKRSLFHWKAALVWAGTLLACSVMPLHLYYRWLPGYVLALAAYLLLARRAVHAENPA
jgi:purine-cytosine permease-like protein